MTSHTFYPEGHGGVEKHVLTLAEHLISKGHEVGVFYRIRAPGKEEYRLTEGEWQGIPVFRVVRNFIPSSPNPYSYYDRQIEERFHRVLDQYRPDLVHIHHLGGLSTSLVGASKRRELPTIWTLHDFWPMCKLSHLLTPDNRLCPGPDHGMRCVECVWLQSQSVNQPVSIGARIQELGLWRSLLRAPRFLHDFFAMKLGRRDPLWDALLKLPARDYHMRDIVTQADLLVSPSKFLIDKFEEWGISKSKFYYLQNGVPGALLNAPTLGEEGGRSLTFGFIGSLYPHKGVHILLEAFQKALLSNAVLKVWGGATAPQVQRYVARLKRQSYKNEAITFEGRFDPNDLIMVLRQIDVLVMPSILYENNSLSMLEALAMRIPIVAGNVGGMAELVEHDRNGLLFEVGDADDLANKLRMMSDGRRVERYREAIRPPRSVAEVADELESLYREFVE